MVLYCSLQSTRRTASHYTLYNNDAKTFGGVYHDAIVSLACHSSDAAEPFCRLRALIFVDQFMYVTDYDLCVAVRVNRATGLLNTILGVVKSCRISNLFCGSPTTSKTLLNPKAI